MSADIDWQIGVEIELIAPPGSSRADYARALADACAGRVRSIWHQDTEPSLVGAQGVFENLTQGFEVYDAAGNLVVRCVDDLTLQHDLHRHAAPKPGWWRILSDDPRLLRLIGRHVDPAAQLPEALATVLPVFPAELMTVPDGVYRLIDPAGAPLALAAPLPGERERGCELITPPMRAGQARALTRLLELARRLGFTVPREGATHLHFDAAPLCNAGAIANLVLLFSTHGPALRRLCKTPAHFRRVGTWPGALLSCVNAIDFRSLPWPEAQARLRTLGLSKYCDFNLKNIAYGRESLHTFEVRILPAYLDPEAVLLAAGLFAALLHHCTDLTSTADPASWTGLSLASLLERLPMSVVHRDYWLARAASDQAEDDGSDR